ncbi:MAG: hypothetical protein KC503_19510 [Myxococcales bacterium]|nr:hypothetical protein [Myxococcales bacterium]
MPRPLATTLCVLLSLLSVLAASPAGALPNERRPRLRGRQRVTFRLKDINRNYWPAGETIEQHRQRETNNAELKARDYNCESCVLALDATLAGHPTSALAHGAPLGNDWFRRRFNAGRSGYIVPRSGQRIIDDEGKTIRNVDVPPIRILTKAMQDFGAGSRAIIIGYYRDERGEWCAHLFNAVNQRGKVRFLDGQKGRDAAVTDFFTYFELLRTDKPAK